MVNGKCTSQMIDLDYCSLNGWMGGINYFALGIGN